MSFEYTHVINFQIPKMPENVDVYPPGFIPDNPQPQHPPRNIYKQPYPQHPRINHRPIVIHVQPLSNDQQPGNNKNKR